MAESFKQKRIPWFLRAKDEDRGNMGDMGDKGVTVDTDKGKQGLPGNSSPAPDNNRGNKGDMGDKGVTVDTDKGKQGLPGNSSPVNRGTVPSKSSKWVGLANRLNRWADQLDQMQLPSPARLGRPFFKLTLFATLLALPFYFLPPVFPHFYFWREIGLIAVALGLLLGLALYLGFPEKGVTLAKATPFNTALLTALVVWVLAIAFSPARLASLTSTTAWGYLALLIIAFMLVNFYSLYRSKFWRLILGGEILLLLLFWALLFSPWLAKFNSVLNLNLTRPQILSLTSSWSIGVEAVQNRPFLGNGPGLYTSAFLQYRPFSLNALENWAVTHTHPYWPGLEALASFGLLGAGAVILMVWGVRKSLGSLSNPGDLRAPAAQENGPAPALGPTQAAALVLLIMAVLGSWAGSRVVRAQREFQSALGKVAINAPANDVYLTLQRAINSNPYNSDYHRAYGQVSFTLANLIAANQTQSADQQSTIQQLINQSTQQTRIITEALNPLDARNWQTRGQIYRQLIGAAQDAEAWGIDAYQNAIALSPSDPSLRIELGGIYFQLAQTAAFQAQQLTNAAPTQEVTQEQIDTARQNTLEAKDNYFDLTIEQFRIAVRLKPDLPNARFNLGFAYQEAGRKNLARLEFERTLALLDPEESPEDARRVKEVLEAITTPAVTPTPSPTLLEFGE